MSKKEDKETRYFMDLDLKTKKIIKLDTSQRYKIDQMLDNPTYHRVFLTKGQYNKLEKKLLNIG